MHLSTDRSILHSIIKENLGIVNNIFILDMTLFPSMTHQASHNNPFSITVQSSLEVIFVHSG
jgi:hypothetical protein